MFPDPTWLVAVTILAFVALPALLGAAVALTRFACALPTQRPAGWYAGPAMVAVAAPVNVR